MQGSNVQNIKSGAAFVLFFVSLILTGEVGGIRAQSANVAFASVNPIGVGNDPRGAVAGDFNGDGKLDAAVANFASDSVSILFGNGAGGFAPPLNVAVDDAPGAIAAGDFNRDGKLDFVTAHPNGHFVRLWLGDGAGNFAANSIRSASAPQALAIGDLNGDGNLDAVAANGANNSVTTFFSNGAGFFTGGGTTAVAGSPVSVTTGDFDRDGRLDYATANQTGDSITVARGTGNGGFNFTSYSVGGAPQTVVATHFNHDGYLDLVTSNAGSSAGGTTLLLGTGDGTFSQIISLTNTRSLSVFPADFNNDGNIDLARSRNFVSSLSFDVQRGDGAGALNNAGVFQLGYEASQIIGGDFNRDGRIDVLTVYPSGNIVGFSLNTSSDCSTPKFPVPRTFSIGNQSPSSMVTADFDSDGKLDIATTNPGDASPNPDNVRILFNEGNGNFTASGFVTVGADPVNIATADFNLDGNADLVVTNLNSDFASVLYGNGGGRFQRVDYPVGGIGRNDVAVGDFNSDGKPDFVVSIGVKNLLKVEVAFMLSNGSGGFTRSATYNLGSEIKFITTFDFNSDSAPDIAAANEGQIVAVLLNRGDGTFFASPYTFSAGGQPTSITSGDYNGDGKIDLATANYNASAFPPVSSVSVLINNGSGFNPAVTYPTIGNQPIFIITGDINRDGKPDLATANKLSDTASVFLNDGSGVFQTATYPVESDPISIAQGDFNGDGSPDLVALHDEKKIVSIIDGNGAGGFRTAQLFPIGKQPFDFIGDSTFDLIEGDFNRDGILDVAAANTRGNNVGVIFGRAAGGFTSPIFLSLNGDSPLAIITGDFNRDNKLDIVTANNDSDNVSLFFGDGAGHFSSELIFPAGAAPQSVDKGDFNRDGFLDLAVTNSVSNGSVSLLFGTAGGGFLPPQSFNIGGDNPMKVVVSDFNADGNLDLALTVNYRTGSQGIIDGFFTVYLGNGNGSFQPTQIHSLPYPTAMAVADFNHDSKPDLVVSAGATFAGNENDYKVYVSLNQGAGQFSTPVELLTRQAGFRAPHMLAAVDINRDGTIDIVQAGESTNTFGINLGNGNGTFGSPNIFRTQPGPRAVRVFDYNRDGQLDVLLADGNNSIIVNPNICTATTLSPTAAGVEIGGRVLTADGKAVASAQVMLTDSSGTTRYSDTNASGYYRFSDVATGATVVVQVNHKRYQFTPQVVSVNEELTELDFNALPSKREEKFK